MRLISLIILFLFWLKPFNCYAIWAVSGDPKSCTAKPGSLEEFVSTLSAQGTDCTIDETIIKGAYLMNCGQNEGYMLADSLKKCKEMIKLHKKLEDEETNTKHSTKSKVLNEKIKAWEALGVNPASCKPSMHKSFGELVELIDGGSPNFKYTVMPSTERFGYYALGTDHSTIAVWADTQDKCNFGLQASKIKMAMADADAEFKSMETEKKSKITSNVSSVLKNYCEMYNRQYSTDIPVETYKKMLKEFLPETYKKFIK